MTVFLTLLPVLIVLALSLIIGLAGWILGEIFNAAAAVLDVSAQAIYGGKVFNVDHHHSSKVAIWAITVSALALCVGAIVLSLYHYQLLAYASAFLGGIVLPDGVMKLLTIHQDKTADNR
jgi:hypothetical protein